MKVINIGIAVCLGRMGQDLVKETIRNNRVNFTGGFEDSKHKNLNDQISDLISVNSDHIVSDNPKKIFSDSDVIIDFTTPQSTLNDIEIAETHHKHKVDSPSGTALSLGEYAALGRSKNFNEVKNLDRINSSTKRQEGSIGFAVTRGGEIAGEHTVSFIGTNDRIDLVHKAQNRSIFVKGAIESAIFISDKDNGLYSIENIINLK